MSSESISTIKIGIADDHSLFREGLGMILANMEAVQLCLVAENGRDLLDQLETNPVDVILLDIDMPVMNGKETLKIISKQANRPKVIMLSMHMEPRMISLMMELGANSYLPKDVKREELETAIRTVYDEGIYLNESISKSMLSALKSKSTKIELPFEFSEREREILELILQEFTTKEIGDKLCISERTVEGHRKNMCIKFGVKNTIGLLRKAISLNIIKDIGQD